MRTKVGIPQARSMTRERVERLLDEAWSHRLTIVAAPAGSGKTTLLASWAAAGRATGRQVAWYRAESTDAAVPAFLAYIQLAIGDALAGDLSSKTRGARHTWRSIEDVAAWLERHQDCPLLLVIDDYHHLAGSAAEAGLARLLNLAPPGFAVVIGSRSVPTIDVSRWRLAGELLEITGEDLRFRLWEVERLFRDHYGEVLRGDELGRLARRTEGWAAGLQFFHLATTGKSPGERTRLLEALPGSARLIREYLARNVLDELPDDLREFLVTTCLLRRLSGPLCDRFLDISGSAARLEELARRQVFTVSLEDGTYRYHEVLQAHLEQILTAARGEAGVRRLAARAATLLEDEGALAEALMAYCRAEHWEDAARVLGSGGDRLEPSGSAGWLADVAPALIRNDPWLRLASARRLRAEGHWNASLEAFSQAEGAFGASEASARCHAERQALAAFLAPDVRPPSHWSGVLRTGLRHNPRTSHLGESAAARDVHRGAPERLALGLLDLAAGFVRTARATLIDVSLDAEAEPSIVAAASIGAGAAGVMAGDAGGGQDLERGTTMAERAGENWLACLGRGLLMIGTSPLTPESLGEVRAFRAEAGRAEDGWGGILYALIEGWARLMLPPTANLDDGDAAIVGPLEGAAAASSRLGAGVLEAWARALGALALARLEDPRAREAALRAEVVSRTAGVRGALVPVHLALAISDPGRTSQHLALTEAVGRETGLRIPVAAWAEGERKISGTDRPEPDAAHMGARTRPVTSPGEPTAPPLVIHLFGGFAMQIAGRPVNLATIKPRPRAILRLLALNAGQPIHREVLAETFWPDTNPLTASRNVQVAISGLRRELCNGNGSESGLLVRSGDAYRLAVPPGAEIDLAAAEEALSAARTAHLRQDGEAEAAAFRRAMELASRELLPEDGPAEWVIYRREELRTSLTGAARALAESTLADDAEAAAEACAAGLRLDPHHDGLWRLLIETHERAGDLASAEAARQGYARMLDQLGVEGAGR